MKTLPLATLELERLRRNCYRMIALHEESIKACEDCEDSPERQTDMEYWENELNAQKALLEHLYQLSGID